MRLDPTPLMTPAVVAVLQAVPGVRFVGGCVRDLLRGEIGPATDIDMATPLSPDDVMARAVAVGLKAVPTGIKHGTVTIVADGTGIEVTTLREDVETFGRHARVAFTDDWKADAARRDFTMNALYLEADGALHDYFGGVMDAKAGQVRFIGKAEDRIVEDALRILRFYRFHARFGGDFDAEGRAACVAGKAALAKVSIERVQAELVKLLAAPHAYETLQALEIDAVLEAVLPGTRITERIRLSADPLLRLFAWAGDCGSKLKLSNADKARLTAMNGSLPPLSNPADKARALYTLGRQTLSDRLILAGRGDEVALLGEPPRFPLRGRDLKGRFEGKVLGAILALLETRWLEGGCVATSAELVETLTEEDVKLAHVRGNEGDREGV